MNVQNKDLFIFKYLEGELGNSEKALAEDLYANDNDFKNEVDTFKLSYFQKDASLVGIRSKEILYPKSKIMYWVSGVLAVAFLVSIFYYQDLKSKNELLVSQLIQRQNKPFVIETQEKKDKHSIQDTRKIVSMETKFDLSKSKQNTLFSNQLIDKNTIALLEIETHETYAISETVFYPETVLDSSAFEIITKNNESEKKEKTQKKLSVQEKIQRAIIKMKYSNHKEKGKPATWEEIKEAFKKQRVIPME